MGDGTWKRHRGETGAGDGTSNETSYPVSPILRRDRTLHERVGTSREDKGTWKQDFCTGRRPTSVVWVPRLVSGWVCPLLFATNDIQRLYVPNSTDVSWLSGDVGGKLGVGP